MLPNVHVLGRSNSQSVDESELEAGVGESGCAAAYRRRLEVWQRCFRGAECHVAAGVGIQRGEVSVYGDFAAALDSVIALHPSKAGVGRGLLQRQWSAILNGAHELHPASAG